MAMAAEIDIQPIRGDTYRVEVTDDRSPSTHEVTIDKRPMPDVADEDLLRASFLFLLDREPKESILSRFDLSAISRYFPEYEARLGDYL